MNKILKAAILFISLAVLSGSFLISASAVDHYMVTNEFNVDIIVHENNSCEVTETIKVNFLTPRHGIYRYIPYKGTVVREIDGQEVISKYRAKVSDLKVDGFEFITGTESGSKYIKIGSENQYVTGEQTYVIQYTYTRPDDKIESFDDFYLNVLPLAWETDIYNAKVTITMPKSFDAKKIEFLGGVYGEAQTDLFNYKVDGLKITATSNRVIKQGEGATVKINLPEGYYVGEKTDASLYTLMVTLMIAPFLIIFLLWLWAGRDEKIIPVVSFYPPEGMNSAETGYIIDGTVDNNDVVSMLIYLADKGYLSIEQTGKKTFNIIKEKDLPPDAKSFEKTFFNGLFANGNIISTNDIKTSTSFYNAFVAAKTLIKGYFSNDKKIYTQKSIFARALSFILQLIPIAAFTLIASYIIIAPEYLYIIAVFALFFIAMLTIAMMAVYDKRKAMSRPKYVSAFSALSVITSIMVLGLSFIGLYSSGNYPLWILSIIVTVFSVVLTLRMKTRTHQSNIWMQDILGFKDFIAHAELDRIKLLVEDDPKYFYSVLPFAYAFGLTDKWIKNFENLAIEQPTWYASSYGMSHFNMYLLSNAFSSSVNDAIAKNIAAQASKNSGGGGSFSGGGGFSGGGFGGGGGGSW